MDPIRVTVRRGPLVEAVHRVHAVAVKDGRIVDSAGDSGARHLLPLVVEADPGAAARPRARRRLRHRGRDRLRVAPRGAPAARGRARPARPRAGDRGRPRARPPGGARPEPALHNCSGKHAGMLAVCRVRGWPIEGYRLAEHPMQQLLLDEVAGARRAAADGIPTASTGAASSRSRCRSSGWRRRSRACAEVEGGPDRRSDDRAPRADRLRARRDGHRSDAPAAGLDREGRRGGADLRGDRPTARRRLKAEDGSIRALRPGARIVPRPRR